MLDTDQPIQTNSPLGSLPFRKRLQVRWVIFTVIGVFLLFIAYFLGTSIGGQNNTSGAQQVSLTQPTLTKQVNKSFTFPVTDTTGKEIAHFTYLIQSLQLQNEII